MKTCFNIYLSKKSSSGRCTSRFEALRLLVLPPQFEGVSISWQISSILYSSSSCFLGHLQMEPVTGAFCRHLIIAQNFGGLIN